MKEAGQTILMYEIFPVTADRWPDLEDLFGPRGAVAGCWCMWWRLPRKEFNSESGEGNRASFQKVVETGRAPGLLAYHEQKPVGWVAVAPRDEYPALERSRILSRVDEQQVWSITCFFVARAYRRKGVMQTLIDAAVQFARDQGAQIVEAYPIEARSGKVPGTFAWTGLAEAFRRAGFDEVARRSPTRPIMRWQA